MDFQGVPKTLKMIPKGAQGHPRTPKWSSKTDNPLGQDGLVGSRRGVKNFDPVIPYAYGLVLDYAAFVFWRMLWSEAM